MLVTPTTSNTARIGPPAMTPVPSDAGCMNTLVAPWRPTTAWCSDPLFSRTLIIRRRASSIAFCTATGTSFAFPLPMPTRPSPSPTTVSAANARMRPPFTTLVTRLMLIIFSRRPSPRSSCCCLPCCLPIGFAIFGPVLGVALELQAALAGALGHRLDAAVILVPGAVERDRLDPQRPGLFGNAPADQRRRRAVAAIFRVLADLALERRRAGQHLIAVRRDDLRVDMAIGPADDQPVCPLLGDACPGFAGAAHTSFALVHQPVSSLDSPAGYFFLVSLITTRSSA